MKRVRLLLIGAAVTVALLLIGLVVALNSSLQTWAVRRWLAHNPDLHLAIGRVSAGFGRVELRDVRYEHDGIRFTAPTVVADLPVLSAVLRDRVAVRRAVANGWTLDFSAASPPAPAAPAAASRLQPESERTANPADAAAVPASLPGVVTGMQLPFDLAIGRLEAAGNVVLPGSCGTAAVRLDGGGLDARREGKFDLAVETALTGAALKSVWIRGTVSVAMASPRTLQRVASEIEVTADRATPRPVALRAEWAVERVGSGERYHVRIAERERQVLVVQASRPLAGGRFAGSWKIDVREEDLAPFALGRELPAITATGEGTLDADVALDVVHAVGRLDATLDRLAALSPALAGVGAVRATADVDLARRGDVLAVTKLDVEFAASAGDRAAGGGGKPVAGVRSLQPFEFNPRRGELRAAEVDRDLVGIVLHAMPLAWARPFLAGVELAGSGVRGELLATPRAGGFRFVSKAPLSVRKLSASCAGEPLLRDVDVSLNASGDYTPQGWQAELTGVASASGGASLLLLDAKVGRLAGADQPVKATGLLTVDLPLLLGQPVVGAATSAGMVSAASFEARTQLLTRGDAAIEFAASIGAAKALQAKVTIQRLAAEGRASAQPLPTLNATLRADVAADGGVTFNVPLTLERDRHVSDITLVGTYTPRDGAGTFDAQVTSNAFDLDDAEALVALAPSRSLAPGSGETSRQPAAPAWAGLSGAVTLQLKQVVRSGAFRLGSVTGVLRLAGGRMKLEHVHAAVGEAGDATVDGAVAFDDHSSGEYTFGGGITLADFDPAPWFRSASPRQPPPIEGRFAATSQITARAATLKALPRATTGTVELTSRGGTFRGLPVNVGSLVENSGKLASWLASAGHAITSIAGRKDYEEDITSRSQAASELARLLSSIVYDQLNLVLLRDGSMSTTVKELTLISPEVRLTGTGRAYYVPGTSILNDTLVLDYQLRVRGRPAELMRYLGVLDPNADNLGYSACTIPVKVGGSVGRIDATEFSNQLVALAVQKSGLTDKAVDWFNRLRGK